MRICYACVPLIMLALQGLHMHSVISLMRVKLGILQVKKGGGLSINATVTLTQMSEKMAQLILHEYSILSSCHSN